MSTEVTAIAKPPKELDIGERAEIQHISESLLKKSEDVQVAIFFNCIGEEALDLFNTFGLDYESTTYKSVYEEFYKHLSSKKRYKFYKRCQKEQDPFKSYLMDLKKFASTCEFDSKLNEALRDRIIIGSQNAPLQEKLLRWRN
ncbi:hypothetical protein JTB14_027301 [Gonioctena quinquepunctata]|nr:hypothetical protein JTB14_027301 [Gonioctena quinquepunctata]